MRLFVAIELSAEVKRALQQAQARLRAFNSMVRWTKVEQMHLTLKFLGEAPDQQVPDICAAAARAAEAAGPFRMTVGGSGVFPPRGRVRIVWVGLNESTGRLIQCQEAVEEQLQPLGFPGEERGFTPHLTIGRVTEDRSDGELRRSVEAMPMAAVGQEVDSIVLVQSELRPEGARYTPVGTWRLGGSEAKGGR